MMRRMEEEHSQHMY